MSDAKMAGNDEVNGDTTGETWYNPNQHSNTNQDTEGEWSTVGKRNSVPMTKAIEEGHSIASSNDTSRVGNTDDQDENYMEEDEDEDDDEEEQDNEVDMINAPQNTTIGVKIEMLEEHCASYGNIHVPEVININDEDDDDGDGVSHMSLSTLDTKSVKTGASTTTSGGKSSKTGKSTKSGNTSKSGKGNSKWSKEQYEEIMFSFHYARTLGLTKTQGALDIWRERNPSLYPKITALHLSNLRRVYEKKISKAANDVIKEKAALAASQDRRYKKQKSTQAKLSIGSKTSVRSDADQSSVITAQQNNLTRSGENMNPVTSKTKADVEQMAKMSAKYALQTLQGQSSYTKVSLKDGVQLASNTIPEEQVILDVDDNGQHDDDLVLLSDNESELKTPNNSPKRKRGQTLSTTGSNNKSPNKGPKINDDQKTAHNGTQIVSPDGKQGNQQCQRRGKKDRSKQSEEGNEQIVTKENSTESVSNEIASKLTQSIKNMFQRQSKPKTRGQGAQDQQTRDTNPNGTSSTKGSDQQSNTQQPSESSGGRGRGHSRRGRVRGGRTGAMSTLPPVQPKTTTTPSNLQQSTTQSQTKFSVNQLDSHRRYKERFDIRIAITASADKETSNQEIATNISNLLTCIHGEESSLVLYPFSSTSSAPAIIGVKNLPLTIADYRKYIPRLSAPSHGTTAVYGSIYIGTNTHFDDWKLNVVEWTKEKRHGLYRKFLQTEKTVVTGWLHHTHQKSNASWYQKLLTGTAGFPIDARYRRISGSKHQDQSAIHIETSREDYEKAKLFLREHFSKETQPPYLTGFPVYHIPDRVHIMNNHSRSGAALYKSRQSSLNKNVVTRGNWSVSGIDRVNKEHGISLRTMVSQIHWTDKTGKERQLFHSIDETFRGDGVIFAWHPEFDDQANMVMTGLLAYLKSIYGTVVEEYFTEDCIAMQAHQKWDMAKGGIINDDDDMLALAQETPSWWDEATINADQKVVDEVPNIVTSKVPTETDNDSLPTCNTKSVSPVELQLPSLVTKILNDKPPDSPRKGDAGTVSSGLTLDTVAGRVERMEASVVGFQTEVAEVNNSMNHTNMILEQICAHLNIQKKAVGNEQPDGNKS